MLGIDKWIVGDAWAHVGVEVKGCACRNIQAFVASALGSGDWRFEKYFGSAQ